MKEAESLLLLLPSALSPSATSVVSSDDGRS
eukprot:CAMPEP_0170886572 /NCGR_PEP_ID=MMETSP0734-20130129/36877_1 /TAXON_ID=186038 /ORGANISM="Fragilariopsis kerguelensis, Strain L26-C5" /LENGTH=30 /DNA_ID= /DNA_START= /DNA_END= /DNA_ORIENTATION=